ncbi:MAG: SDR family NAD(P)-dependent oxidoreductase [bacterium]
MNQAIIIGATSGIGRELALILARNGYTIGITGRRTELLAELQAELPGKSFRRTMDIADTEKAMATLERLLTEMGDVELLVICAGVGFIDPELPWARERKTVAVNVLGFTAIANVAYHHFQARGSGHLVGISSIAALRGGPAPAYNASKAFMSNYLQGLRYRVTKQHQPITITDIQPGFVDTAMAQGDGLFWVASPRKAAAQIFDAIRNKKEHAYVTRRWRLVAWFMKLVPDWLYRKL